MLGKLGETQSPLGNRCFILLFQGDALDILVIFEVLTEIIRIAFGMQGSLVQIQSSRPLVILLNQGVRV